MTEFLLVQYRTPTARLRAGLAIDGTVHALPEGWPTTVLEILQRWPEFGEALRGGAGDGWPVVEGAELVAPITYPPKVLCAGANYYSHAEEMGTARPDPDATPFFFLKPPTTTIVGPDAVVPMPSGPDVRLDWEGELAVVIGRGGRDLPVHEARAAVAGYLVADDLSARGLFSRPDAVFPPFSFDWLAHKGQDGSCPIGPGIAPAWTAPDIESRRLTTSVNGERTQDSLIGDLVVGIDGLVSAASRLVTLEPGDVILTGTPAGVGLPRDTFLGVGDVVEVAVEGIGAIRHTIGPPRGATAQHHDHEELQP
jgi:2-keto-4-pentenoate hydratase/2-oxohepta-3-ene-1,7-dioic acid hydratase in catechol pathway